MLIELFLGIGACRPNCRELDDECMELCDLFVDSRTAAYEESGDIIASKVSFADFNIKKYYGLQYICSQSSLRRKNKGCTALLTLLMMTTEPLLSKRSVLRITV